MLISRVDEMSLGLVQLAVLALAGLLDAADLSVLSQVKVLLPLMLATGICCRWWLYVGPRSAFFLSLAVIVPVNIRHIRSQDVLSIEVDFPEVDDSVHGFVVVETETKRIRLFVSSAEGVPRLREQVEIAFGRHRIAFDERQ